MATLKISDLSVGDWVRYDGKEYQVQCVDGLSEIVTLFGYCEQREESAGNLRPIPITAEILEKNGWTSDEMCAEMRITEYSHLEYYFREHRLREWVSREAGWLPGEIVTSITFAAHCYNVHQLQHALRLAGVDNEINL